MRTLNVYEVGVDPLPDENESIYFYDTHSSFGFETLTENMGNVSYVWGFGNEDEPETLEEALKLYPITIDDCGHTDDDITTGITVHVGETEVQLMRGMTWCYEHEYLKAINSDIEFPFQSINNIIAALKKNWITVKSTERELGDFSGEVQPIYEYNVYEYDGNLYKICLVYAGNLEPYFLRWEKL